MDEIPMHRYYNVSDAIEDSYFSNDSKELPPSFSELLERHGYTIKKELGQGASGRVFLVNDTDGDPHVVKQLNYRDEEELVTIQKEVNSLKTLNHGYIVTYENSFDDKDSGLFFVVIEYCTGDLYTKMKTQKVKGFFEEQQILDWLVQICLALQYLHPKIPRDIKPQNIFLTEDDYINLGFGSSKTLESADARAESELYASPEVVFQKKCNSKSDIWSLGWLLHDLCMLDVWSDIIERHCAHAVSMKGNAPPISERYSEELQELIRQMFSCDPEDRPSADEILAKPFLKDAVKKNKRIPKALEKRFIKSIKTFDEAYIKHYKDFELFVKEWGETTTSFKEIHHRCTIGSLSGSVIGAAGGITAVVGAVLALFTFGASLIVTAVGVGVGVAGGVAGAASSITNTVQQKSLRERLEQIQQNYKNASEPILNSLKMLQRELTKITKFSDFVRRPAYDNVQIPCNLGSRKVTCAAELMNLALLANAGRLAAQSAKVGRVVAAASGVLSGILVIVDIAFIVKDSIEIHQMNQGKINDPEKVSSSVLKGIEQMKNTHAELCEILKVIKEKREELKKYLPGVSKGVA